jgi:hypothetical protein
MDLQVADLAVVVFLIEEYLVYLLFRLTLDQNLHRRVFFLLLLKMNLNKLT